METSLFKSLNGEITSTVPKHALSSRKPCKTGAHQEEHFAFLLFVCVCGNPLGDPSFRIMALKLKHVGNFTE